MADGRFHLDGCVVYTGIDPWLNCDTLLFYAYETRFSDGKKIDLASFG